jgi:O-antigen ligase
MTSPFLGIFSPREESVQSSSNWLELSLQVVVYLTVVILVFNHWQDFSRGISNSKWPIALAVLAITSALWADDPLLAFRRGVVVAATTLFGIYFGTRYRRAEQLSLLCCAFALIGLMSVAMVAVFPQYGIDPFSDRPDWRGVYETKNALGKVMALATIVALCSLSKGITRISIPLLAFLGFFGLVVLSRSATAAVVSCALLSLLLAYRCLRMRVNGLLAIAMLSFAVLAVLLPIGLTHSDELFNLLGRDETFTGRTPLWDAVVIAISKKPLLGYGFNGFWQGDVGPSASVAAMVGWIPPHSHNGFLDLCLDLGLAGLIIFGIGFLAGVRTAIIDYRSLNYRAGMWPLVYLTWILLYNLTESTLLRANSLYWMLYVASFVRDLPALGPGSPEVATE